MVVLLDDHHLLAVMMMAPAEMMAAVVAALDDHRLGFGLRVRHGSHEGKAEGSRKRDGKRLHLFLRWVQSRHRQCASAPRVPGAARYAQCFPAWSRTAAQRPARHAMLSVFPHGLAPPRNARRGMQCPVSPAWSRTAAQRPARHAMLSVFPHGLAPPRNARRGMQCPVSPAWSRTAAQRPARHAMLSVFPHGLAPPSGASCNAQCFPAWPRTAAQRPARHAMPGAAASRAAPQRPARHAKQWEMLMSPTNSLHACMVSRYNAPPTTCAQEGVMAKGQMRSTKEKKK